MPTWTGPTKDNQGHMRPAVTTCCKSAVVGLLGQVPHYQILTGSLDGARDMRCYRCNAALEPPQ